MASSYRVAVARIAADESERFIAKALRLDITKAIDPTTPGGFMSITTRFARELAKEAHALERPAILRAVQRLDVDWANLTASQRMAAVQAANRALLSIEQKVPPKVETTISFQAQVMAQGAKKAAVREYGLKIGSSLTETDLEVARRIGANQSNFVRDEYGRRRVEFSRVAREIVADGLSKGLGREDIAEDLATRLGEQGLMRTDPYWRLVASTFANRARTQTTLGAFNEGGIDKYQFEAVLDEHTTEICRYLHGKIFTTSRGLGTLNTIDASDDPESIREVTPWVRNGTDEDGHSILYFNRGEERVTVARVVESAYGKPDEIGEFSHGLKDHDLEAHGITMPPVHAFCRSTVIALESSAATGAPPPAQEPETPPTPPKPLGLHPSLEVDRPPKQESIEYAYGTSAEDVEKALGRKFSKEDLASLTGMSDGKVSIRKIEQGKMIELEAERSIKGGTVYMNRTLSNEKGRLLLHNELFQIEGELGTGAGAKFFSQQVAHARRLGVDRIETSAARSKRFNGYYTWARFGYEGEVLPKDHTLGGALYQVGDETAEDRDRRVRASTETLKSTGYKRISEFMATAEGRELWKEHGHWFHGTFDLSDGSYSVRTLSAYLHERDQKPK